MFGQGDGPRSWIFSPGVCTDHRSTGADNDQTGARRRPNCRSRTRQTNRALSWRAQLSPFDGVGDCDAARLSSPAALVLYYTGDSKRKSERLNQSRRPLQKRTPQLARDSCTGTVFEIIKKAGYLSKVTDFDPPHLHLAPPSNFADIFGVRKLESLGYRVVLFACSYV